MKASIDRITMRNLGKLDPIRQHRAKMLDLMTLKHVRKGVCIGGNDRPYRDKVRDEKVISNLATIRLKSLLFTGTMR